MLIEFVKAVTLIFFAEMGDKTQILAMAFATKYRIRTVLLGIMIGSFLNHGLAVMLGSALSTVIPIESLQIVAGISFVGFALWTLKLDSDEDEETKRNFGPIITIALAFFIGELGDKTQLTAIVLSTDAKYPLLILLGTVTGMVITGGLGIFVGLKLGAKIPEFTIKMVSASVFMLFGIIKLGQNVPAEFLQLWSISIFVVAVGTMAYLILKPTIALRKAGDTAFQRSAQTLKDFYSSLRTRIDDICLGEDVCGNCRDSECIIGATKHLLDLEDESFEIDFETVNKDFDRLKIIKSLNSILEFINKGGEHTIVISDTMHNLERILLDTEVEYTNVEEYLKRVRNINPEIALHLAENIK